MNCEEISELLPAYVLGALEPDEVEAVEAHLRAGREHDAELVDLRATVFALDRYNDELVGEPQAVAPAASDSRRDAVRPRGFLAASTWRLAGMAAAVVLLFGAGWAAGQLVTGGGETYAYAIEGPDGAFMEVSGDTSEDHVLVTMLGLERLDGRSYQVWAIRDGEWVSIGVCNTNAEGAWIGDFDFSLQSGEEVALTIEPRGGSPAPTGEAILRSR